MKLIERCFVADSGAVNKKANREHTQIQSSRLDTYDGTETYRYFIIKDQQGKVQHLRLREVHIMEFQNWEENDFLVTFDNTTNCSG